MPKLVQATVWLAIELFYLMTFGLAAWLKWSQGTPDWFAKQFGSTWLAHAPFGVAGAFYFIAVLETGAFFGFLLSLLRLEWLRSEPVLLRLSLAFSMLVFLVLAYGSRLTGKFDIAGWNYLYLFGTLVTAHLLTRPKALSQTTLS
ncbi:MAG: hypothetical protein ABIQ16_13570 [Polyangiaceae bacterium]